MAISKKNNEAHLILTEHLADLLLKEYVLRLECHTISDTGMANVQRLLAGLGWVIDDEALNSVRSKLTDYVDPRQFTDEAIVGRISA